MSQQLFRNLSLTLSNSSLSDWFSILLIIIAVTTVLGNADTLISHLY